MFMPSIWNFLDYADYACVGRECRRVRDTAGSARPTRAGFASSRENDAEGVSRRNCFEDALFGTSSPYRAAELFARSHPAICWRSASSRSRSMPGLYAHPRQHEYHVSVDAFAAGAGTCGQPPMPAVRRRKRRCRDRARRDIATARSPVVRGSGRR